MGYGDYDTSKSAVERKPLTVHQSPAELVPWWGSLVGVLTDCLTLLVRGVGVVLLVIGLWIAVAVVFEAWALYQDPARIARLAAVIETHTGVDALLSAAGSKDGANGRVPLRLSYLLGWFLAPALLFTAGYLSMNAARIGGQLALGVRRGVANVEP